jgi:hypothetical protein
MRELHASANPQIRAVDQGDDNFVVYDGDVAVWDLWSYEAAHGNPTGPSPSIPTGAVKVIQVTQPADGPFHPRMYSYWANAWMMGDYAIVFAGHVDGRARFFQVDLQDGRVTPLGMRIKYAASTTEGWYWDRNGHISLCDGPRLCRINPFILHDAGEILVDISTSHPGCRLWQAHSSDDGLVHSATVERITSDGPYERIGTLLIASNEQTTFFPAMGALDESQVTRDGAYLVIKENEDNRIVTVATGEERIIPDAAGAVGHSDCGDAIMVGEDNQLGACVLWDLPTLTKRPLFSTWNMGYVSLRGGRCLHSGNTHLSLVALDGGGLTPLIANGGGSSYDDRVKANLDPSGRIACYMANGLVYLLVL